MKQKYLVKSFILILMHFTVISSWANGASTTRSSLQPSVPALQIIKPFMVLDKQAVRSIKLAASDDNYGRVELTLSSEVSKLMNLKSSFKQDEKLIFTINNEIVEALMIQKEMDKDYFLISISTSRKNIDMLMKYFA